MNSEEITLERWIQLGRESFEDSRILMFKSIAERRMPNIPMYLLHFSVEIYLKAFLFNAQLKGEIWGHNLVDLFNKCLELDPKINIQNFKTEDAPYNQDYWINYINPFGYPKGGRKYLNSNKPRWSYTVLIHDFLDDLLKYIESNVDLTRNISKYIL